MDPTQLNHYAFYYSPLLHLRLHVRLNRQTKIHFNTYPEISTLLDLSFKSTGISPTKSNRAAFHIYVLPLNSFQASEPWGITASRSLSPLVSSSSLSASGRRPMGILARCIKPGSLICYHLSYKMRMSGLHLRT